MKRATPARNVKPSRGMRRRRGNRKRRLALRDLQVGLRRSSEAVGVRAWWVLRLSARHLLRATPYAMLAVICALLPVTVVYGYRYVMHTSDFGVREVSVTGQQRVTAQHILEVAGIDNSPNVLSLDLDAVRARLLEDPWIRSASVERQLPDRLVVKVQENSPVALVALGALYLADQHGALFKRVEAGEHFDLPVLTGLHKDDLAPGAPADRRLLAQRMVRGALELLEQWERSGLGSGAVRVGEVHMDPLFGYGVVLGEGTPSGAGTMVHLGFGEVVEKLARLEALLADATRRGRRLAEVRLNDERDATRVTVRFLPGGLEPAEGPISGGEGGASDTDDGGEPRRGRE